MNESFSESSHDEQIRNDDTFIYEFAYLDRGSISLSLSHFSAVSPNEFPSNDTLCPSNVLVPKFLGTGSVESGISDHTRETYCEKPATLKLARHVA